MVGLENVRRRTGTVRHMANPKTNILDLIKAFVSDDEKAFDVGIASGLSAVLESSRDFLIALTKTKEGVGLSAFVLGIILKQSKMMATVDLFPFEFGGVPGTGETAQVEMCEVVQGDYTIEVIPCSQYEKERKGSLIKKYPVGTEVPSLGGIGADFGKVFVYDILIWTGLFLMYGQIPLDIIKTFINARKV